MKPRHSLQANARGLINVLILLLGMGGTILCAQETSLHTLKAALVYKLSKFVVWPAAIMEKENTFRICSVGHSPLKGALNALTRKTSHTLPIETHSNLDSIIDTGHCHIAFIHPRDIDYAALLNNHRPTLMISDAKGFAENGGDIEIKQVGSRFHFIINLSVVKAKGLKISASLLQLSTVIEQAAPK